MSSDDSKKKTRPAWDILFNDETIRNSLEGATMLEQLIGRKIKVWSAFNDTIGGTRGLYKATEGYLENIDSEFILLSGGRYLSRKFIHRIELAD